MKVLVTGGAGYKGCVLVPKLLAAGHEVTVVDTLWFGNNLPAHPALKIVQRDIREGVDCAGQQAIIHLAGIANDPCGELDAKLTWEVNVLAHMLLCDAAARAGVERFIFASSASVYGIHDNEAVTEESDLCPVSDYNKTKMVAERVLLSYADRMAIQIIRPATICGMSPRMRLDTVVNMLTAQALTDGKIVAHCGQHGAQLMRPNTHIQDITDLYVWILRGAAESFVYNAGFENLSIGETAALIQQEIDAEVTISEVRDKRSYCVDSSRLLHQGFTPQYRVIDAIKEIAKAHRAGCLNVDERSVNLKWMRRNGLVRDVR